MENIIGLTELFAIDDLFNDVKLSQLSSCSKIKVFILGYPCEVGARNMNARTGCDRAPDTFRELLIQNSYPCDPIFHGGKRPTLATTLRLLDLGNIPGHAIDEATWKDA